MAVDPIMQAILQLEKRAERADEQQLVDTFVDVGALFTALSTTDSQVIFGRRGTGKTHAIKYLGETIKRSNEVSIYLSLDSIGSTQGLYSDGGYTIADRATRLLVDVLNAIHNSLLDYILARDDISTAAFQASDALAEAMTDVVVEGPITQEQVAEGSSSQGTSTGASVALGASPSLTLGANDASRTASRYELRRRTEGIERHRVHIGAVQGALRRLADALPGDRVWLLLDEWSSVPLELQPFLADMLRRSVMSIPKVTIKVAAIEHRSRFRTTGESGDYVGMEIGADIFGDIDLDDFMVFGNDAERATEFFLRLLYRHVTAALLEMEEEPPSTETAFLQRTFTQRPAFQELVVRR
jgi:hypothetical protein